MILVRASLSDAVRKMAYVTGVDNFSRILRFDERDILSNTSEVEYAVVNRLYAKRTSDKPENCDATGMASLIIGHPAAESPVPWERQLERGGGPAVVDPPPRRAGRGRGGDRDGNSDNYRRARRAREIRVNERAVRPFRGTPTSCKSPSGSCWPSSSRSS